MDSVGDCTRERNNVLEHESVDPAGASALMQLPSDILRVILTKLNIQEQNQVTPCTKQSLSCFRKTFRCAKFCTSTYVRNISARTARMAPLLVQNELATECGPPSNSVAVLRYVMRSALCRR